MKIHIIVMALILNSCIHIHSMNQITSNSFDAESKYYIEEQTTLWSKAVGYHHSIMGLAKIYKDMANIPTESIIKDQNVLDTANNIFTRTKQLNLPVIPIYTLNIQGAATIHSSMEKIIQTLKMLSIVRDMYPDLTVPSENLLQLLCGQQANKNDLGFKNAFIEHNNSINTYTFAPYAKAMLLVEAYSMD